MHIIFLVPTERNALKHFSQESPIKQIRLQSQAILMRDRGISVSDIASVVFRSERTVTGWFKNFVKTRLASIFSGKVNNENSAKLTKEQREEIKNVIGLAPDEYGIPKEFWDVPKLKNYLKAEFGVVYKSDTSYHFLLKFSGLSLKYPDLVSHRKNEEAVKKRIEEIRKEIKPLLNDDSWMVFASDETRLQKEAEIRRAWLKKGVRTVIKTERSKEHQNYMDFLDQKTNLCQIFEIKRGNSKETICVLKKLVKQYTDKRISIVWDNAKWHKSKQLREELSNDKSLERINLISLEPYAPETNPIEHVWGFAKSKLANKMNELFEDTKSQFLELINNKNFSCKI